MVSYLIMPYYKKRRTYRKRKRNVPFWKRKYSLSDVSKQVWNLKQLINVEKKFHDYGNILSYTTTPAITPISLIAQGDTANTRNGNSIKLVSNLLRYDIMLGTTGGGIDEPESVRMMVVMDTQNNGSTPAITDILEGNGGVYNPLERDQNAGRFTVLMDRVHSLNPNGKQSVFSKCYNKLNTHMKFNGTDATAASQGRNAMYLVGMCSNSQVTVNAYNRVSFIDN
mgnify:CR=1 FL=1